MNKRKLNRVFEEIKQKANLAYAITNPDQYGDCNTCVNTELASEFGIDSKGIYAKHWRTGMNAGCAWSKLDAVYIAHDITAEQAEIMVNVLEENGYIVEPREYNPTRCFNIKEE